jgi:hypothetical protein
MRFHRTIAQASPPMRQMNKGNWGAHLTAPQLLFPRKAGTVSRFDSVLLHSLLHVHRAVFPRRHIGCAYLGLGLLPL